MYPILLISHHDEQTHEFIARYSAENTFSTSFMFEIRPLKTEITIDQIRDLKKHIVTSTKEKRLIILYSFDNANIEAQNALLKTLEEKNEYNQFILVVSSLEKALPTIRSRSTVMYASNQLVEKTVRESTRMLFQNLVANDSYGFLADSTIQGISKEEVSVLLKELIYLLRENYLRQSHVPLPVVKKLLDVKYKLESNNLNPQLAIDSALIALKKSYNA